MKSITLHADVTSKASLYIEKNKNAAICNATLCMRSKCCVAV